MKTKKKTAHRTASALDAVLERILRVGQVADTATIEITLEGGNFRAQLNGLDVRSVWFERLEDAVTDLHNCFLLELRQERRRTNEKVERLERLEVGDG